MALLRRSWGAAAQASHLQAGRRRFLFLQFPNAADTRPVPPPDPFILHIDRQSDTTAFDLLNLA